jgi:N-acyl-L-homoserine lactone synthetase
MIQVIQGAQRGHFLREIDAMHRIRAMVFADRLGWDVEVRNGWEIDRFDDENPLYLISIDSNTQAVRGSLRLLPTTGPNMLRDVFSCLLPDGEIVESATIWESTRFSVHPDFVSERSPNKLNRTTGELLAGIVEVGMLAGLTEVVSVYDARMARILKSAGCPAEIIGVPRRVGNVMTYAGLFEISVNMLSNIRKASGISEPVLEPNSLEIASAA